MKVLKLICVGALCFFMPLLTCLFLLGAFK